MKKKCLFLIGSLLIFLMAITQISFINVSAEDKQITGVEISGEPYQTVFIRGTVINIYLHIFPKMCDGMQARFHYSDGSSGEWMEADDWHTYGLSPLIRDKGTGKDIAENWRLVPDGNYELNIRYNDIAVHAFDFQIKAPEELVNQNLTISEPVLYEKTDAVYRETYTRFTAEVDGKYKFFVSADEEINNQAIYVKNEEGRTLVSSYKDNVTYEADLRAGQKYYIMVKSTDSYQISVSKNEVVSKEIVGVPSGGQLLYKLKDVKTFDDIRAVFENNMMVKVSYQEGEPTYLSLFNASANTELDFRFVYAIKDRDKEVALNDKVDIGAYQFEYWIVNNPELGEAPDNTVKFYVFCEFQDIQTESWYFNDVSMISAEQIMTGINDTQFAPADVLPRAQFATILYRMAGEPEGDFVNDFPDVPADSFFTKPVMWAASEDVSVITGYTNGLFGPGDNITREQLAVMLYRYAQYSRYDTSDKVEIQSFPDAKNVSGFAKEAVKWAVGGGIITGDQGKINPQGNANRAECAAILNRFFKKYNL